MNRSLITTILVSLLISGLSPFRPIQAWETGALDSNYRTGGDLGAHRSTASTLGSLATTSFNWVDITGVGVPLQQEDWKDMEGKPNDDEGHALVELPGPFPWFGVSYTTLYVDPNGNLGFVDWPVDTWVGDNRIPSLGQPDGRIAAFYEDMAGRYTGACGGKEDSVYTSYDREQERFIVEYYHWCSWKNIEDPNANRLNTFEVILYPDGQVLVQYLEVPSAPPFLTEGNPPGPSAVGIESTDGALGLVWSGEVKNGTAWLYRPSSLPGPNLILLPQILR